SIIKTNLFNKKILYVKLNINDNFTIMFKAMISCILFIHSLESSGQVTVDQTPTVKSVSPGESLSISCTFSSAPYSDSWGAQAPKLLFYRTNSRHGSGSSFTLTISNIQPEDAADYYCQGIHVISSRAVFTQLSVALSVIISVSHHMFKTGADKRHLCRTEKFSV
uniref:Ig-like domain-containing protein n=1 Tax=Astyanax mexicanus TaxID=7994 RepID=A0A3B1K5H0_ASTMX